jgi:hypothetical protein
MKNLQLVHSEMNEQNMRLVDKPKNENIEI